MDLYLCEKPNQAEALADVLSGSSNGYSRKNGYFVIDDETQVTWAVGHLFELAPPHAYDPKLKQWRIEDLPIIPANEKWKKNLKRSAGAQFKSIKSRIESCDNLFVATDFDREGELLAYEIWNNCSFKGPIRRVCLTSLDSRSIERSLEQTVDIASTVSMSYAASARQRADWIIGYNWSRLMTLLARQVGVNETFQIGRVLTPTIALVCNRDREIVDHIAEPYCKMSVVVAMGRDQFKADWVCPEEYADEKKRCRDAQYASYALGSCKDQTGVVSSYEHKRRKHNASLPADLSYLQRIANERWNYTPAETLKALQGMYESRRCISYPRTECRYLPSSQIHDAPEVLKAIASTSLIAEKMVSKVTQDKIFNARVFNDSKVGAHHAIIPTTTAVKANDMTRIEQRLYDVISRLYIAQFYPKHEYFEKKITIECNGQLFRARGTTEIAQGWKRILGNKDILIDEKEKEDDLESLSPKTSDSIPEALEYMSKVQIVSGGLTHHMTTPPSHFSESSLLHAMTHISRFVEDIELKKTLDNTSGIGTPATRADIIDNAFKKNYIEKRGKLVIATVKAFNLIDTLPFELVDASTTARWEQRLELIETGAMSMNEFVDQINEWTEDMILQMTDNFRGNAE